MQALIRKWKVAERDLSSVGGKHARLCRGLRGKKGERCRLLCERARNPVCSPFHSHLPRSSFFPRVIRRFARDSASTRENSRGRKRSSSASYEKKIRREMRGAKAERTKMLRKERLRLSRGIKKRENAGALIWLGKIKRNKESKVDRNAGKLREVLEKEKGMEFVYRFTSL